MKTENWLNFQRWIWGLWETSRSSLRRIIRIMCPSKMTWWSSVTLLIRKFSAIQRSGMWWSEKITGCFTCRKGREKMPWQITRKPMCIHWNKALKLRPELQKCGTGFWTGAWISSITMWLPIKRHFIRSICRRSQRWLESGIPEWILLQNIWKKIPTWNLIFWQIIWGSLLKNTSCSENMILTWTI